MSRSATTAAYSTPPPDEDDSELVPTEADEEVALAQGPCSRPPSCRRSSSPAGWPKESLISLNRSRSTKRKARLSRLRDVVLGEEGVEDAEQVAPVPQAGELVGHGLAVALWLRLQAPDREDEPEADHQERDDRQGEGEPADRDSVPDEQETRAAVAARIGRVKSAAARGSSGFDGSGRSHTAMDISMMAVGQAMALKMKPNWVALIPRINGICGDTRRADLRRQPADDFGA